MNSTTRFRDSSVAFPGSESSSSRFFAGYRDTRKSPDVAPPWFMATRLSCWATLLLLPERLNLEQEATPRDWPEDWRLLGVRDSHRDTSVGNSVPGVAGSVGFINKSAVISVIAPVVDEVPFKGHQISITEYQSRNSCIVCVFTSWSRIPCSGDLRRQISNLRHRNSAVRSFIRTVLFCFSRGYGVN